MSATQIWQTAHEEGIASTDLLQLRTPLTGYRKDSLGVIPYILDNGAYTAFPARTFHRMAADALQDEQCLYIVMPDIVGDHIGTVNCFFHWMERLGIPDGPVQDKLAFVAQNGCTVETLDDAVWDRIGCLFIGGDDEFKEGHEAFRLIEEAKIRNKWVHIGRVNTSRKIIYFHGLGDSFDGSGIARFTEVRKNAIRMLKILEGTEQERITRWAEWVE
jgi:hypothetical protein